MSHRILITGSSGLVGSALWLALQTRGIEVRGLDLRGRGVDAGDVRDVEHVHAAVQDCDGVIQLAAVSRVIWAERDPALCRETNVDGLRNVLEAALQSRRRPWLLFASSREVYGQPTRLPATEDAPLRPVNTYGRSKVEGERMVEAAKTEGLRAAIIRLSNVFGSTTDHADRVVPAFARAAARGLPLRVEGAEHTFDFTHMDDVTRGILALVELSARRTRGAASHPVRQRHPHDPRGTRSAGHADRGRHIDLDLCPASRLRRGAVLRQSRSRSSTSRLVAPGLAPAGADSPHR